jgi:hypothetical protein
MCGGFQIGGGDATRGGRVLHSLFADRLAEVKEWRTKQHGR